MDKECLWQESLPERKIRCLLCPRHCVLAPGQRGFCFGRINRDGKLFLSTYGKSSGFAIDPVEKKPLHQFFPGSSTLSFGTIGCNLNCLFCQNSHISRGAKMELLTEEGSPDEIVKAAKHYGCQSVSFTYNEPIVFSEYAMDTADQCHEQGLKTIAVTAGYIEPLPAKVFFSRMDAANVDLKGFSEDFYKKNSQADLKTVLNTLKFLKHETGVWLEITNLIIPTLNDEEGMIRSMCQWIVKELGMDVPLHFSAFYPCYKMMDLPRTPLSSLRRAYEIAAEEGIRYVYTGNVSWPEGEATYCPGCGKKVIIRSGYEIREQHLQGDECKYCMGKVAGRYE